MPLNSSFTANNNGLKNAYRANAGSGQRYLRVRGVHPSQEEKLLEHECNNKRAVAGAI
ncbi:hypothetical protein [Paenibacillus terricola]|uniref:hypothetical protein n=1 Tax=Paenibacillus terricola TaxID=2763503 RepID=UPI002963F100|nr:hypothetical protein [Paenibacillus terricola]